MTTLPKDELSYWTESVKPLSLPSLTHSLSVDVCVIGGGIAGLTTAYLLKRAGRSVAVLEKDTIGGGVTGHTTGKVTSQHGLIYKKLQERFGTERARLYGEANQSAIQQIERILKAEKIDCSWEADNNFVYTEDAEEVSKLKEEAKIASELGLPASFETKLPLPFSVKGAVKFTGQAKIHARKYVQELARSIIGNGSFVFENTKASSVRDGDNCTVQANGKMVIARDVVIATNVPFPYVTHGVYCAMEYPLKSYIVASHATEPLKGMYITSGSPVRSILPVSTDDGTLLLIGGESHIPGLGKNMERHQALAEYAKERFNMEKIEYRWSARDYLAYDDVPLIGKLYPWSKHLYVATAFMKWGLTSSTVAGMILRDLICDYKNPWAEVFDSTRLSPIQAIPHAIGKALGIK